MYKNTIQDAVSKANTLDWKNGMATTPVTVERKGCYMKVIRKCGNLDRPEIILFKIIPKNGMDPDYDSIAGSIKEAMGLYGDISINILDHGYNQDPTKTVVIGNE